MKKYSINPKLNKCLNGIEVALLSILDTKAESLEIMIIIVISIISAYAAGIYVGRNWKKFTTE